MAVHITPSSPLVRADQLSFREHVTLHRIEQLLFRGFGFETSH
jgi:hypothetical protein